MQKIQKIDMVTITDAELQRILRAVNQGKAIIVATATGTTVTWR